MKDLVDTTEMYLRTIYELEEEGVTPLRARIAERLEQSGPTVSQTVARMERDGLVVVSQDRSLRMTAYGRNLAIAVMRKHRLAELLLTEMVHLDIHKVHAEACRWEHVMSEEVERCLVKVLPDVSRSPFGNPIPGLAELGVTLDKEIPAGLRLIDLPNNAPVKAIVVQLNEILQVDDEQYRALTEAGIDVGSEITVLFDNGVIALEKDGTVVELADDLAHAVRVTPLS
ncbi:MAG: iron dependent repressor, metal binding and dimerization domain protein [Corynebacterium sp.]|nr:iron dependent repressor, metal binding and dimerization domain protein [Corynebacterium sp.]